MSSATSSDRALMTTCTRTSSSALPVDANCTSLRMSRTAILGLCPSGDRKPVEKACTMNVLRPASMAKRQVVFSALVFSVSEDGCTLGCSLHRPEFQIALQVRKGILREAADSCLAQIFPYQRVRKYQPCAEYDERNATEHEQSVPVSCALRVMIARCHGFLLLVVSSNCLLIHVFGPREAC